MRFVVVGILGASLGCLSKPGSRPGAPDAQTVNVVHCETVQFNAVSGTVVADFSAKAISSIRDPVERSDRLELWTVLSDANDSNHWHLYVSTRMSPEDPYSDPVLASFSAPTFDEGQPTLSGDGLDLLYVSTRSGAQHVWETQRSAIDQAFAMPQLVLGIDTTVADALTATPDGLHLYMSDYSSSKFQGAVRTARGQPFMVTQLNIGGGFAAAAVAPDELELFDVSNGTDYVELNTRPDLGHPFNAVNTVVMMSTRPSISSDATRLYYAASSAATKVFALTRTCPAP